MRRSTSAKSAGRNVFARAGVILLASAWLCWGSVPPELQVGIAGHAFDHLGAIGNQAEAAAESGANIIYVTGLGTFGYQGLPTPVEIIKETKATRAYLSNARRRGISLAIGYICATSIVNLGAFDKNWPAQFRSDFRSPPSDWRQQDENGAPLPSWYGGDYQPACMNNPDWRSYERGIVRLQLEGGCDGVFFDNPTVHPKGCYCPHCMNRFENFARKEGFDIEQKSESRIGALRAFARKNPKQFLRFRCTIGRDFLKEMREFARTIKPTALITANNSLNSADVLFSQSRTYAYNISELSRAEDFVVVEDMSSQPRILPKGQVIEYSPTYKQLHAISHGKPIVAVTLAEADYHTPPFLVRLAMAEAAANDASYLSWPTWPESERAQMIRAIRPQADFLRQNAGFFENASARNDVVLLLPFEKWLVTERCEASRVAKELSRANVQFEVISDETLAGVEQTIFEGKFPANSVQPIPKALRRAKVFLVESLSDLDSGQLKLVKQFTRQGGSVIATKTGDWMNQCQQAVGQPSVEVRGAPAVRAIVRDQPSRIVVHLLNLDVQRISSSQERVTPVENLRMAVRVPFRNVRSVRALSADAGGTFNSLAFSRSEKGDGNLVEITLPRLEIAALLIIE